MSEISNLLAGFASRKTGEIGTAVDGMRERLTYSTAQLETDAAALQAAAAYSTQQIQVLHD